MWTCSVTMLRTVLRMFPRSHHTMEVIQHRLSSSHSLPGSRTQPQDSEKMSWNQGFERGSLKIKQKHHHSTAWCYLPLNFPQTTLWSSDLGITSTFIDTAFLFHLPESVFTRTPRGSAVASGRPSGFESPKRLSDPKAALCPARSFFHLWCLPGLLIFAICECLDIPFIFLE